MPINQTYITAFLQLENKYLSQTVVDKPRVGYLCLRTPVELIEALSAVPLRLAPQSGFDIYEYGGIRPDGCSFCRMLPSFLKTPRYSGLSAIIGGACCDQMRRVMDTLKRNMNLPVILFGAPRTWNTGREYFRTEMEKAFGKLAGITGKKLTDDIILKRIKARNQLKAKITRLRQDGTLHTSLLHKIANTPCPAEMVSEFLDKLESCSFNIDKARLMLAGSIPGSWELSEIENAGAEAAADATCLGDRAFHHLVDETGNPLDALYQAYIEENLCPHRRPMTPLIDYIKRLADERKVEGVVYLTLKYCHPWGLSAKRMKWELNLPFLHLDDDFTSPAINAFRTRVGAFVEMLKSKSRRRVS
ncbi:MAG: 2-hydroxyacyl-CoA dehydratase [candidate division Zixibacteria bacterium]|nr:2-hydroxyacyl-CoA dehydratase [Candidatus Tariuqbacter arcticus]